MLEILFYWQEQLEKEKQQNDGRPMSEKTYEKKRK